MRKQLMAAAAAAALFFVTPAVAADREALIGGTAGAWTGGTIGFFLGGPVGAVIGAWTGGAIGASVLSDDIDFAPGRDLEVDYDLDVGVVIGDDIRLRQIEGEDDYGYFRADGNIYIVDLRTREIVEMRDG
jgi:hypothetical protein